MKRRDFFTTILLAIGSLFCQRRSQAFVGPVKPPPLHTSGYLQANPNLGSPAFANRFLERYEGRAIPSNVVLGQVVGRINQTPYHPQEHLKTKVLRSVTKE
jgi:hypothetical protein